MAEMETMACKVDEQARARRSLFHVEYKKRMPANAETISQAI